MILGPKELFSQNQEKIAETHFVKTDEQFKNGEYVWEFINEKKERIGEFWPVHGINLVTRETDPEIFEGSLENLQQKLGGVATAPDGMTCSSVGGSYAMEGKCLSNGRECGNREIKNYGIVVVKNGFDITFTHALEHQNDFDSLYNEVKNGKGTLFFLPSVYRRGRFISSDNKIDKVLVRREVPIDKGTPKGEQMGVIIFDQAMTYNEARQSILGLDRSGISETTHIYVLDGGPAWGESTKEINGQTIPIGTRDPKVVTNYLVFY